MECKLGDIVEERGIKITWLSERSGVSRNAIHTYLKGSAPSLDKAYAIAKILGLSIYDIWPQN